MRSPRLSRVALVATLLGCRTPAPTPPTKPADDPEVTRFVDPFIGTDDGDSPDPPPGDKGGSVFPGATVPFGMIQWSPDTAPGSEFSYHHRDDRIKAFSVTHISGPGCASLLDFPFLPTTVTPTRPPSQDKASLWPKFSHADEVAAPGYYGVQLGNGIGVRLTARTRAGFGQFTFPVAATAGLLVEAGKSVDDGETKVQDGEIKLVSPNRLVATLSSNDFCGSKSSYKVHLAATFDHAVVESASWGKDGFRTGGRDGTGPRSGLWLRFDTKDSATVGVAVAVSYVSQANALANLEASNPGDGFEAIRGEAGRIWNERLGAVQVRGGTEAERRTFYTALYHTLLHPNVFSDVNGDFMGMDNQVHNASGYVHYANVSGWDVYRSWIQLAAIVAPREANDLVRSLVVNAEHCGGLPRWSLANDETGVMVGDPGALIVANGYAFGLRGFDARAALDVMVKGATAPKLKCNRHAVRPGGRLYAELGYLPADAPETGWGPTSTTLEYAVADFAIGQMAKAVGAPDTATKMLARSRNWRNVFNPATGYVQPRLRAGGFKEPWTPGSPDTYVEGNGAQYTFFVPHDVPGLVAVLGGNDKTRARLDALFAQLNSGVSQPYFYIGNEPQFGTPWLYNHTGAPWKTQEVVRRIVTRTFTDKPGGLPGNDDLGATSSWFVWANLGLYPDVPGVAGLTVASPLFPRVDVKLPDGKTLVIEATNAAADKPFVQDLTLDGAKVTSPWIPWTALAKGARLAFVLGAQPNTAWGKEPPPRHFD